MVLENSSNQKLIQYLLRYFICRKDQFSSNSFTFCNTFLILNLTAIFISDMLASPLRSPNKEKPRISFKHSPSLLKQSPNFNVQLKFKQGLKSQQKQEPAKLKKLNSIDKKTSETQNERFGFQSVEVPIDELNQLKNKSEVKKTQKVNCQKCSKRKGSYVIVEDDLVCCSNCALEQMKRGKQVRQIGVNEKKIASSPQIPKANEHLNIIRKSRQEQDEVQIKRIEKDCNRVLEMINNRLDQKKVSQDYEKKRGQLKKHYQKLKEVIQMAIKKDLENLKMQEKNQLSRTKNLKLQLKKDVDELMSLKQTKNYRYGKENSQMSELKTDSRVELDKFQKRLCEYEKSSTYTWSQYKLHLYEPSAFMMTTQSQSHLQFSLERAQNLVFVKVSSSNVRLQTKDQQE